MRRAVKSQLVRDLDFRRFFFLRRQNLSRFASILQLNCTLCSCGSTVPVDYTITALHPPRYASRIVTRARLSTLAGDSYALPRHHHFVATLLTCDSRAAPPPTRFIALDSSRILIASVASSS